MFDLKLEVVHTDLYFVILHFLVIKKWCWLGVFFPTGHLLDCFVLFFPHGALCAILDWIVSFSRIFLITIIISFQYVH